MDKTIKALKAQWRAACAELDEIEAMDLTEHQARCMVPKRCHLQGQREAYMLSWRMLERESKGLTP